MAPQDSIGPIHTAVAAVSRVQERFERLLAQLRAQRDVSLLNYIEALDRATKQTSQLLEVLKSHSESKD